MAFSYDWHSDDFSYKEKGAATVPSSVMKRKKKKKNLLNGHSDTPDSDAIESASKKLKLCSEDSSPSNSQPKNTVESLLTGVVSTAQVKSAIKTTVKSKQLSVSFADDVKSTSHKNGKASASKNNAAARNCSNVEGSKTQQKQKKKIAKTIDRATAVVSKKPSSIKVNGAPVNGTKFDAIDNATPAAEPVSDASKVKKRKKKVTPKVTDAEEFRDVDSSSLSGPSKKKKKIDLQGNSSTNVSSSDKKTSSQSKASERNSDGEEKGKVSTMKKKTCESNDNEDDWEDLDSDVDWDSIDVGDEEVLDYSNEEEPELDEKFHSDLKSLIVELNFEAIKNKIELEGNADDDWEEETAEESDCVTDEEEENHDSDDNISDEGSQADKKSRKELKSINDDGCEMTPVTNSSLQENGSSQEEVTNPHSMAGQKIGASLAKFGMPLGDNMKTLKSSLAQKMSQKLNVAKFRMINEQLYKTTGSEAQALFRDDPASFRVYHEGFKSQVALWPLKPLDIIVDWLKIQDSKWTVADFGCGEGELADRVKQKVHSLDLVALRPHITVCDMAHTPLKEQSINVAVFCLSLMGTNVSDFIKEANRTLKAGGIMKIAEVESRITNVEEFVANVQKFGFKCWKKPVNHNYFVSFDFKKVKDIKNRENLPEIRLKPCLYKKR